MGNRRSVHRAFIAMGLVIVGATLGAPASMARSPDCGKDASVLLVHIGQVLGAKIQKTPTEACNTEPSTTRRPVPEALVSQDAFITRFASRWKASCPSAKELERPLLGSFKEAAYEGFLNLWQVNPDLVEDRLRKFTELKLNVTCGDSAEKKDYGLAMTLRRRFGKGIEIKLSPRVYQTFSAQKNESPLKQALVQRVKNVFFHELLHAVNVQNRSDSKHNSIMVGPGRTAEADTTYACSAQGIPTYAIQELQDQGGYFRYYGNTYLACMTCALVRPDGGKTLLACDSGAVLQAHEKCRAVLERPDEHRLSRVQLDAISALNGF